MTMRKSKALMASVGLAIIGLSAAAQTVNVPPPPGPYQAAPAPSRPAPIWNNIMPMPYWMQNRVRSRAPAVAPNTVGQPVYPQTSQQQQSQGWGPNMFGFQGQTGMRGQYSQGYNSNYGPNFGQMPPFFPNGPWSGFSAPAGPIYGYQPPARPQQ